MIADPHASLERYAVLGTITGSASSIGAAIVLGSPLVSAALVGGAVGAMTGRLYAWLKCRGG